MTHVPPGYQAVTPYFVTRNAAAFLDFAAAAFGATERSRTTRPDGTVIHAEIIIDGTVLMVGEACDKHPAVPMMMYLYTPDCHAAYQRALAAGAKPLKEPTLEFNGDRVGGITDPFNNQWWLAQRIQPSA